jgi:hypothetical protein
MLGESLWHGKRKPTGVNNYIPRSLGRLQSMKVALATIMDFFRGLRFRNIPRKKLRDRSAGGIPVADGADAISDSRAQPSPGAEYAVRLTLGEDGRSLRLGVLDGGDGTGAIQFVADQIDQLIVALAAKRSEMQPAVPAEPPARTGHDISADHLHTEVDGFTGKIKLSFRSPGYGWMTYQVSAEQLEVIRVNYARVISHLSEPHTASTQ